jgi:pyruvate/2-oxoglutarate dehydrogenase complex dihydrolipoamide dehydrogenase (E3) component
MFNFNLSNFRKYSGMKKYDAIIIGAGQAGKPLAIDFADNGWKVAIIEKKHVGGSCINYGCTPTKTMIASAKAISIAERGNEFGFDSGRVKVVFEKIINRRNKIVKDFRDGSLKQLEEKKNIDLIKGKAYFSGEKKITVELSQKETIELTGKYIFINTGTIPLIPKIVGIDSINYFTSVSIMDLKELPEHLLIIGGGYIGLEFAQMYRRFGSEVTVIEAGEFLPKEDEDVSVEMKNILEEDGIKFLIKSKAKNVSQDKNGITLSVESGSSNKKITGSHLLIASGTEPASSELNTGNANIETNDKGFIITNDRLETNVDGIYALGDVKGGPAFTHISYDDFRIVRDNLIRKKNRTEKDRVSPYTVFTDPQLARIGLNEKEANEKEINFKIAKLEMTKVARAIETGETKGFIKALVDPDSDEILGCTVLAADGGELMSMIQIAMEGKLPYTKLRDEVFAHPLLAEALNNLFWKVG